MTIATRSPTPRTPTEVDAERIGVWGSSYSGGHVLVVGAIDRRVKCVVSQVPLVSGYEQLPAPGAAGLHRPASGRSSTPTAKRASAARRRRWCRWCAEIRWRRRRCRRRTPTSGSPRPAASARRRGATRSRCARVEMFSEYEPGTLHRLDQPDAAADGASRDDDVWRVADMAIAAYRTRPGAQEAGDAAGRPLRRLRAATSRPPRARRATGS